MSAGAARRQLVKLLAELEPADWMAEGACIDVGPEVMFPTTPAGVARAKAVCSSCTVADACRARALRVGEPAGVWGGLTAAERAELLAPRRGPRPAAAEHGTESAYKRCARRPEGACDECKAGHRAAVAEWRRSRGAVNAV